MAEDISEKVRLDKWLWAARFYKTRAIAKAAITKGQVTIDGNRVKCAREVTLNTTITLQVGHEQKTVIVTAISDQRRSASEAARLYRETTESIALREQRAAERKLAYAVNGAPPKPPNKKQRRQIHRFQRKASI